MKSIIKCAALGACLLLPALCPSAGEDAKPAAAERARLTRLVSEYATLCRAGAEELKKIKLLVKDLSSADFGRRQAASAALVKFGSKALPALKKAAAGKDVEAAERARAAVAAIERDGRAARILDDLWISWNAARAVIRARLAALKKDGSAEAARDAAVLEALSGALSLDDPKKADCAGKVAEIYFKCLLRGDARRTLDCSAGAGAAMGLCIIEMFKKEERLRRMSFKSLTVNKREEKEGFVFLTGIFVVGRSGPDGGPGRDDREQFLMIVRKLSGRWRVVWFFDGKKIPKKKGAYSHATLVRYEDYHKDPKKTIKSLLHLMPEDFRGNVERDLLAPRPGAPGVKAIDR
jgi:hypothetical protein